MYVGGKGMAVAEEALVVHMAVAQPHERSKGQFTCAERC